MLNKAIQFIKETRAETKKVVWPNRKYVTAATVIILLVVVITVIYVSFVDLALSNILGALIK